MALIMPLRIFTMGRMNNAVDFIQFDDGVSLSTSQAWPGANRAIYVPVQISGDFTVARFMVCNNAAVSGDVDVGLYSDAGSKLISTGTTGRTGTTQVQYIGVADEAFSAGHYYLALVVSNTSTVLSPGFAAGAAGVVGAGAACGWLQEDLGGTTLPSTMTPVRYTSLRGWLWGFSQSDTL